MSKTKPRLRLATDNVVKQDLVYTLEVNIVNAPVSKKFARANPFVARTIQILGSQTLEDLHRVIFEAFDRFDPHMYEFQVGGDGPDDPAAKRFGPPVDFDLPFDDMPKTLDASRTPIDSLGLELGQIFGYLFDFGDDWRHFIEVLAVYERPKRGNFPKILAKVGASPPQYMDYDEDTEDSSDGEDNDVIICEEVQNRMDEIVALTDDFCRTHLNEEYRALCEEMTREFCKRHASVTRGNAAGWAAGVIYMLGRINFLTDPAGDPHMTTKDIAKEAGVSVATLQAKARVIRETLELTPLAPDWTLPSRVDQNPLIWMLSLNDVIVDIRSAPRDVQVAAYEQGLIPYVPADR